MKRAIAYLEILVFAAGLYWVGHIVRAEMANRRAIVGEIREEREGWAGFHEAQELAEQYDTWTVELDPRDYMADTQITDSYNFSCTMGVYNQDQSPLLTSAALKALRFIQHVDFNIEDRTTLGGWPAGVVPPGEVPGTDGFVYRALWEDPLESPWVWYVKTGDNPQWFWVGTTTGWQMEIAMSIVAQHSHIDSTRTAKVWMGSDSGPTHSNEVVAADAWEASADQQVTYTFGSFTAVSIIGSMAIVPSPTAQMNFAATLHKAATGTIVYGRWKDIQVSNANLQLDALEDPWPGRPTVTVGRGANLEIEQRTAGWVGDTNWSNVLSPGYMADFTELGIADWQGLAHDVRYDPVIVWVWDGKATCPEWQVGGACAPPPGFYPCPWATDGGGIPLYDYGQNPLDFICPFCGTQLRPNGMNKEGWASAAWPDTSETDWTSVGAFADGSAAPLPISELHSIFSPYVQQIAPYAGWTFKAGYVREFWFGGLAWLYDRKSLRTNLIDVA